MRSLLLLLTAVTLTGCSDHKAISEAKAALTATLKDPDSVQFRHITVRVTDAGATVVCGEFNAKNAMGGYGGFDVFGWTKSVDESTQLMTSEMADPGRERELLRIYIKETCAGNTEAALRAIGV